LLGVGRKPTHSICDIVCLGDFNPYPWHVFLNDNEEWQSGDDENDTDENMLQNDKLKDFQKRFSEDRFLTNSHINCSEGFVSNFELVNGNNAINKYVKDSAAFVAHIRYKKDEEISGIKIEGVATVTILNAAYVNVQCAVTNRHVIKEETVFKKSAILSEINGVCEFVQSRHYIHHTERIIGAIASLQRLDLVGFPFGKQMITHGRITAENRRFGKVIELPHDIEGDLKGNSKN
jgi:hypothetical protein